MRRRHGRGRDGGLIAGPHGYRVARRLMTANRMHFALDSLLRLLRGFVRRPWLIAAVTVVTCASLAANAATALLDASYLVPLPAGAPAPRAPTPAPRAPAPRVRPDGDKL